MTNEQLAGKILCHMKNKLEQRTDFAYCIRKSDVEAVTAILDSRPVPESAEKVAAKLVNILIWTNFINITEKKAEAARLIDEYARQCAKEAVDEFIESSKEKKLQKTKKFLAKIAILRKDGES